MIRTHDEIRDERPPLSIANDPETAPESTESAETASGVDGEGVGGSRAAETLSEGDGWNWTPTTDGGSYSGPHGPDICPRMGCQHEGGAA